MNTRRNLLVLSLVLTLLTPHSALAAGRKTVTYKSAGRAASGVPNTILSGVGVPTKLTGIDGDFYIDLKNANLYGPKTKGGWKIVISLRAAESKNIGVPIVGADGVKGDRGERGFTGDNGLIGAKGATGDQGLTGATGSPGATGETGAIGLSGAAGHEGAQGATGDRGATGSVGATGATG